MDRPLGPNANSFERSPVRTAARSIFLVFGLCVVACNTPARAQEDEARRGLWVSADLGYGSARVSCDTCRRGAPLDGLDGLLGVGGTPSPHVRLGAVLEVWEHPLGDSDTFAAITTITAALYYYPRIGSGLFLEVGIGRSDYRVVKGLREGFLFENAHTPVSGTGWGVTVGLGYDVRLSQWLSIGPRVAFAHGDVGTLHSPVQAPVATGWKQNVLSVSVRII